MTSKVLLINPSEKGILENAGDRPPLGILYIASYLEKNGINVKILDLNHQHMIEDGLELDSYDFIGITFTTPMFKRATALAQKLRNLTTAKLVAGGVHSSVDSKSCEPYFDYIIKGEGERAFYELITTPHINEITKKPIVYPELEDLDKIPLPARHLIDMDNYNMKIDGKRTATLITSRGCTNKCVFCSNIHGKTIRAFSAERVYQEIKELKEKYKYNNFYFLDDVFTFDKMRILKICALIKDLDITFRATSRIDLIDKDILAALKLAGLTHLSFGIEHLDDDILRKMGKNVKVKQMKEVIKWCKQIDIKVKGFFIINPPGATKKTAMKSYLMAKKMGIDSMDFYSLVAYPGSILWKHHKKFGMELLSKDFDYDQIHNDINIVSEDFPKEEILEFKKWLKKQN